MLFYETCFKESNINQKQVFWSKYKIITKFEPKKWESLVFGKVYKNCPKIKEKCCFYETCFKESNINQKPLIWSKYKIITKFKRKKWASLVFGKVDKNCLKIMEKCGFTKLASKRVISTGNHLFGPNKK